MTRKTEPRGATTAAVTAAVFAVLIDEGLLLDKLTDHLPLVTRAFLAFPIFGAEAQRPNSDEREQYDRLRERRKRQSPCTIFG